MLAVHYQTAMGTRTRRRVFAPDLLPTKRFLNADLVVWLYPIWWGECPPS